MTIVIVGGALANKPDNGGEAWVRLSWALGFRRLGFEVWLVEQIAPEDCVDVDGGRAQFEESSNRAYFERVTEEFGLGGSATLIYGDLEATAGAPYETLLDRAAEAELLVNISGHITRGELLRAPRTRVYVDLDPGFTQLWDAAGTAELRLAEHDHHVTVGTNVGTASCPIPTGGIEWCPTLPPVLLGEWPAQEPSLRVRRFTTVATWRSPYGRVELNGEPQGLKHDEFRKLIELPHRVGSIEFEIALDIHPGDVADLEALRAHGWRILDAPHAVRDPSSYRDYVQASAAEFSVAQGIYVSARSGWFSDRTACYLASGRPALIQDTGLGSEVPLGLGLVTFNDLDEAIQGAHAIEGDYIAHCRAARTIAERYLDSDVVLARLLERFSTEGAST
jgi:hypothetical protein